MGRIAGSQRVSRMRRDSAALYEQLSQETEMATGFIQNGGLTIATTPERLHVLKRWCEAEAHSVFDHRRFTRELLILSFRHTWRFNLHCDLYIIHPIAACTLLSGHE